MFELVITIITGVLTTNPLVSHHTIPASTPAQCEAMAKENHKAFYDVNNVYEAHVLHTCRKAPSIRV